MRKKWNRIGASVIDFSICISFLKLLVTIITFTPLNKVFALTVQLGPSNASLGLDLIKVLLFIFVYISVFISYNVLTVHKIGGTFGKLILRVHVGDETSTVDKFKKPTVKQLFKREYYKWVLMYATLGLYSIYVLVMIVINNPEIPLKRVLHDKLAKTIIEVWV